MFGTELPALATAALVGIVLNLILSVGDKTSVTKLSETENLWWSILGDILDYTDNPARVFGFGLAANVLGVLAGDVLGRKIVSLQVSSAEVTVIALSIVSVSVACCLY